MKYLTRKQAKLQKTESRSTYFFSFFCSLTIIGWGVINANKSMRKAELLANANILSSTQHILSCSIITIWCNCDEKPRDSLGCSSSLHSSQCTQNRRAERLHMVQESPLPRDISGPPDLHCSRSLTFFHLATKRKRKIVRLFLTQCWMSALQSHFL